MSTSGEVDERRLDEGLMTGSTPSPREEEGSDSDDGEEHFEETVRRGGSLDPASSPQRQPTVTLQNDEAIRGRDDETHTQLLVPMDVEPSVCDTRDESGIPATNVFGACLAAAHRFFMLLPIVLIMLIITLVDVSFLINEFVTGEERYAYITLFTSTSFMIELLVHIGHFGPERFFKYDKMWQWAEAIIVSTSFLVEYVEFILDSVLSRGDLASYVKYMRAVRLFRVFILMKTRSRTISAALRRLVSQDRRRYQRDGFDLDLTYVHPHVIAMSWPSEKVEALYRNHIDQVSRFLDEHHGEHYRVYNLCSERSYDESKFHHRVVRFRLDDHNPAELMMMLRFGEEVDAWIKQHPDNVAVIHCKGGKGRTGTMVCSYLLYSGLMSSAELALKRFGELRTSANAKSFQGVESPSQERFVKYLDRLLHMSVRVPLQRFVRLTHISLHCLPKMYWDIGKLWFAVVSNPNTTRKVHYVSNPTVTFTHEVKPGKKKRGKTIFAEDTDAVEGGIASFFGNMAVSVRSVHEPVSAGKVMACEDFIAQYYEPEVKSNANGKRRLPFGHKETGDGTYMNLAVDVEFNVSAIMPFQNDTILKFFFNEDDPDTLKCPVQAWFHPSFEGTEMRLSKFFVDGPHKDTKNRVFSPDFALHIKFETVPGYIP